ncbi:OprD family outer membrane porin [Enterobacillus tribolii]|uniref:Outer membrane OprD family porin n=1 Tax=Enterobacillus tribolii TaxID=1487935 RepID=A0A370QEK6_9GAMM|nr:OprD family outer membrane porin [Enterobacillus tribolii]MBW7984144.1 outer membrane porin, OprD family [Enterobacillus tribolii]RDK86795.1 outer membrane OprD family porin [Enterobacillus tribolii]
MNLNRTAIAFIALGISATGWAADNNDSIKQTTLMDNVLADPFFRDSQMGLSLKNYWKYLKEENANPKHVHNAWGQGVSVDYQSGYFSDIIGVDAVYYGAVKLGASDYFNSRGVLYNNGSGNKKSNAEGYSKFGQRNIKLKYDVADVQLNARWGWQVLKNFGVISTSTRLSPTTYSGWSGSVSYDDLTLRGAYVENSMDRNSPDKKHFQTNTGREINHLASGDLQWKSRLLDVQYGYGESDNYLRRHLLFTNLKPMDRLNIGTQIYATHALDEYTSMPASKRDFDNNAWHFALDATWKADRWSSKWGIGYTDAQKANEVGFYPRHMSKNSRGTFISMAYAGDDYMRDGELMLATMSDYKLTPDLAVGLAGNIANFNYKGNHVRTGEINAFTRWVPSDPTFKNLTVWAMFGPGWSYKSSGKTPVLTDGRYTRTHTLSSEVIIEYRFRMF